MLKFHFGLVVIHFSLDGLDYTRKSMRNQFKILKTHEEIKKLHRIYNKMVIELNIKF